MASLIVHTVVLPFVSRDDTWAYAQVVVPAVADTWLVPADGTAASIWFRQTFPTVEPDWTAFPGDPGDGVGLGRQATRRTYLLRIAPPDRAHVVLDLLLFESHGARRERLHFSRRRQPDDALSATTARQLADTRLVDAVRELVNAWRTWPAGHDDAVDAARAIAGQNGRWDVAAAITQALRSPGPRAGERILKLARSPREDPEQGGELRPRPAPGHGTRPPPQGTGVHPLPPAARRDSAATQPPQTRPRPSEPMPARPTTPASEPPPARPSPTTSEPPPARPSPTTSEPPTLFTHLDRDEFDEYDDSDEYEIPVTRMKTERRSSRVRVVAPADSVVNSGFALPTSSWEPCSPDRTLQAGAEYLFWLSVEAPLPQSIELEPAGLPRSLPAAAELAVALYTFPGEIEIDGRSAVGLLRLEPDGTARVVRQPRHLPNWPPDRLAFPVRMPRRGRTARLRCNLYWQNLLIQSRLIEVMITRRPKARDAALRSVLDFRIADPTAALARQDSARFAASLQLDEGAKGTHGLRVFADGGGAPLRAEATIAGSDIGTQIGLARSALHRAAWGADSEWREGLQYRYREPASFEQLATDLVSLAVNGFRLHHLLMRSLAMAAGRSVYDVARELRCTMRRPSYVQIALRQSAQRVLPAGLLYDLPLDTQADRLRVCADFERAAADGRYHAASCFQGTCRQAREPDENVVCPGGFWGYRHALGLPVTVGTAAALPSHVDGRAGARVTGGVYRDFQFVDEHRTALGALLPRMRMNLAETRPDTLRELRATQPHLVYFYCHGGVSGAVPYLRVGGGSDGQIITPDNLFNSQIRWESHRPLVFLNGCRTTGLSPETAIDFVNFFVQDAWACGVIGTEITVFEPLATVFAEECLRGFVTHGLPIGAAVRQARIALLAQHNPLGLAYVPFVSPTIRFLRDR